MGFSSTRQRSHGVWLRAMSSYVCASNYGCCSCSRMLPNLQLLETVRELWERLGEGIR